MSYHLSQLASSSQCLTPQPPPSPKQQQLLHDQQELQRPSIPPPTSLPVPEPSDPVSLELPAAEVLPTEATVVESPQDASPEVPSSNEVEDEPRSEVVADVNVDSSSAAPPLNVATNASPSNDSHTMTISTTCTSSSLTNNTTTTQSGAASIFTKSETINSSGSFVARAAPAYKPFNRNYYNNNSQSDSRSNSTTTIASPSITSTSYQVHPQFVAHPHVRPEDHMHGELSVYELEVPGVN